ncbi:ABC transporter ATP-binding protein [candidate division TM6 bacterium RIFCSPHIGHO2_12_FULL_32_22]|nr:MAG: ABC transporter ATP-binding protein [candidate division TM6 bacterium RIFCSPHIGHO2_12_FULL_32_22]
MIELIDIKKNFDDKWIHKGINLVIPKGQMTVVIGRSGQGKSVLLKEIIGLIKPTSGKVLVDNVDITKLTGKALENMFKKFGYVFQFAALLDSLTVFENVGITLLEKKIPLKQVEPIVKEKLAMVDLPLNNLYKYPAELSGGMRKRVGLARTLVTNPEIILYDEPTTGLDPITSRIIHELMYNMQQKLNVTSVVVSHDVEIFNYADNVALLDDGKIRYYGQAKEVWQSNNPYIYQFVRGLPEGPIKTEAKV